MEKLINALIQIRDEANCYSVHHSYVLEKIYDIANNALKDFSNKIVITESSGKVEIDSTGLFQPFPEKMRKR